MVKTVILAIPHGPARCFETPTGKEPWTLEMLHPTGSAPGGVWSTAEVVQAVVEFIE